MENFASSMQGCYPICMVLLQHSFLLVSYASFFAAIIQGHNPSCFLLLQICEFIWYRFFSFPNSTFAIGLTTVIVIACLHCNHLFQPFLCFITFLVLLLFFATFLQLWSIHLWLNRSLDTKAIVYFIVVCHRLCFTMFVSFWFCIALIGCFYRTQVNLGSDLWVRMSVTDLVKETLLKLNWCDSGWWRYQLNTYW